jgi:MerR family transcriptional regulator, light-induced transcriptional regulator
MNFFSIRDIENLTGIKAHTLRIWEQRYQLFIPKRRESKHRFYDNDDLKYILRIAYLYNNGYKISQIAGLSEDQVKKMALEYRPDEDNLEIFINQLTEAAIDLDQVRFDKILHTLVLHTGFEKSIVNVLFPLLKRIGLLWLTGNVIPAQEHFASALIIKKMLVAIDGLERPPDNGDRKVLLFTPVGELHEIPLLFMHYMLKKNGVPHVYLGKNVSMDMLKMVCEQHSVNQLYFHVITNLTKCDIKEYVCRLSRLFPDKEIVFSGSHACQCEGPPSNVRRLMCNEEMLQFTKLQPVLHG